MSAPSTNPAGAVLQQFNVASTRLISLYRERKPVFLALVAGLLGSLAVVRAAWDDYKLYMSYGPGGLPYNFKGWFLSTAVFRPLGVNVFDTKQFEKDPDKRTWLADTWPEKIRNGGRPRVGPHPIPQRQLDQHTSVEMKQKFLQEFNAVANRNADIIQLKPSRYEGRTEAMFVHDRSPVNALGEGMSREVSHVHATGDYSAHVILTPQDAKKVIESGWGQLHPLAGVKILKRMVGRMLPREYVLLYAPRNDEEMQTLLEIVKASVGFMTDSKDVK